ncbi:hypothetical protein G6F61_014451 [Rhizopus arrhizus]|nr:hypothetical protein G6F61_014451 [Rhizopus arrhizus]
MTPSKTPRCPARNWPRTGQAEVPRPPGSGRRELPQDAAGDGARRARHPHQAGRPPAQYAHAGRGQSGETPAHRPRNPGHLRAHRPSPGLEPAVSRTPGFVLRGHVPEPLPGAVQGRAGGARQPPRGHHAQRRDRKSVG